LGVFRDIGRFTRRVKVGVPSILGSRFSPKKYDFSNRDRINAPMQGVALHDSLEILGNFSQLLIFFSIFPLFFFGEIIMWASPPGRRFPAPGKGKTPQKCLLVTPNGGSTV